MKILHYALGFPPYRTGGLTKYCMDLMQSQAEHGFEVALLWPGRMSFFENERISIHSSFYTYKKSENNATSSKIRSFELINPLPIPLDEGIIEIEKFIKAGDFNEYYCFLKKVNPDVIHIHTLMGLHKEFILAAQKLKIRTVFTTHDYFGICPKVTLFCKGHVCGDLNYENCAKCNMTALSMNKIKLMQSRMYRVLKDTRFVKKARIMHRKDFFTVETEEMQTNTNSINVDMYEKYKKLRGFYLSILSNIDIIHFNSEVSKKIYMRYFIPRHSKVISITHRSIKDNRMVKMFDNSKFRITYLAAPKPFKGFNILIKALDELWKDGYQNFELNCYTLTDKAKPYLIAHNGFNHGDLGMIFDKTDLLVAPSLWYETFGFTVLEALSYGVPVIISENVGAKDVIESNKAFVCEPTYESLKERILQIYNDRSELEIMNKEILKLEDKFFINSINEIYSLYTEEDNNQQNDLSNKM